MKATDLMINDWVYLSDKSRYAMQVALIDEYSCTLDFEGLDGIYGDNGIAPIPLTTKLLELNGWNKGSESWYINERFIDINLYGDDDRSFVWFIGGTRRDKVSFGINSVDYVHELQHILRVCGYDDMADNFKIR